MEDMNLNEGISLAHGRCSCGLCHPQWFRNGWVCPESWIDSELSVFSERINTEEIELFFGVYQLKNHEEMSWSRPLTAGRAGRNFESFSLFHAGSVSDLVSLQCFPSLYRTAC